MPSLDEKVGWVGLPEFESLAQKQLLRDLDPFAEPMRSVYDLGCEVNLLDPTRKPTTTSALTALFLKRSLTDLRAIWILATMGYTTSAGSVAAALYENSLTASRVAGDDEAAALLLKDLKAKSPWSAWRLTEDYFERIRRSHKNHGKEQPLDYYKLKTLQKYGEYKWLCQIKHPSVVVARHDADSAMVKAGEFAVLGVPNTTREDLPVKATILFVSGRYVLTAVLDTFASLSMSETDRGKAFDKKFATAHEALKKAFDAYGGAALPFRVWDPDTVEKISELSRKLGVPDVTKSQGSKPSGEG